MVVLQSRQRHARAPTAGERTDSRASRDEKQLLCFALALWNGRDPILKERLFGLTNSEGNHGEDVKEYYFYVDNVPTHSYQRWLYKYPHAEFPYADLIDTNRSRSRHEMEYELVDTGVFDDNRYFDVEVEYIKVDPEDIVCRIVVHNRVDRRGHDQRAPDALVRNTWSWPPHDPKPRIARVDAGQPTMKAEHPRARHLLSVRRARRRAPVLRERVEQRAPVGHRRPRRRIRRTASTITWSTGPRR